MSKAAEADVVMDVNRDYAVPQSTSQGEGVWVRANGYSLKIIADTDGSVTIRAWEQGKEDGDDCEVMELNAVDAG